MPTIPMDDDVQVRVTRGFLGRVTRRSKHGPGGRGESGSCDGDCVKCEAQRLLDDPVPKAGNYPVNLTEAKILERFALIHWAQLDEHLSAEENNWRKDSGIRFGWRLVKRDGGAFWVEGSAGEHRDVRQATEEEIKTMDVFVRVGETVRRGHAFDLETQADELLDRARRVRRGEE